MKKIVTACFATITLSACGGGGSAGQTPPPPPVVTPVAINVAAAYTSFIGQEVTTSAIPAVSPNTGSATLILRGEEDVPFYANGVVQPTATTRVVQFQEVSPGGVLLFQDLWRMHLDAQMQPAGVSLGRSINDYRQCMTVTAKNALPASSSASGVFYSGVWTYRYEQGFRAATFARYCDPSETAQSSVQWSVLPGVPNPYFCMAMTVATHAGKTRICQQSTPAGAISARTWITLFHEDGSVNREYKN